MVDNMLKKKRTGNRIGTGLLLLIVIASGGVMAERSVFSQAVCLPAPRLLTVFPMGAQKGSTVDVTITAQYAEDVSELIFSSSHIRAVARKDSQGNRLDNQFHVSVSPDCPNGLYEARIVTRLGVSTARIFSVGDLPEKTRTTANLSLDKAMELTTDCLCNAYTTRQSVDFYRFQASKGQRVYVQCAAQGIDSKLKPVLILGDADGADLQVERRGGAIDYRIPADGYYTLKVHDLTFAGGKEYFYRLSLRTAQPNELVALHPATRNVNAFSWPPANIDDAATLAEKEPNNGEPGVQQVTLPCDIAGSFYPVADVDVYEFNARKGETWWVEVASERLGRPTDPAIVVQQVVAESGTVSVRDVVELSDIPSPVKVSSNGYSYDGPPYQAGSSDILASFTAPEDGTYRIQISDLFGGTRKDPRNVYRLIVRKARPDFAIVAWSLHMNLRNGDRNALSKPLALRRGGAMILEVVVIRRDGFRGPIELEMKNLPPGVTASGMRIPAGGTRGHVVIYADAKAPAGYSLAKIIGRADIDGKQVMHECFWASMRWPVPNAWSEIPSPRLIGNLPVSVTADEYAPLSLVANEEKIWEVAADAELTIPLVHFRRNDFSGAVMTLKTLGDAFSRNPAFDASLTADLTQVKLDLKKIKPAPGDYSIAFYGSAVAKYQYNRQAVTTWKNEVEKISQEIGRLESEAKRLEKLTGAVTAAQKKKTEDKLADVKTRLNAAKQKLISSRKELSRAETAAKPKDIVDIIVSRPIRIRVLEPKKEPRK